jgi:hypothetical protein
MTLLIRETTTSNFQPVPIGVHAAVCIMVVDLGVQNDSKYKPRRKLYLRWELPNQRTTWHDKNGEQHSGPMTIGKTYTMSLAPKSNLRADLEAWRGRAFTETELRGFDVRTILGKPCMLVISHRDAGDKVFANITAVAAAPKDAALKPCGKLIAYDTDDHDPEMFALLPEWLQKKIDQRRTDPPLGTVTAPAPGGGAPSNAEFNDNIPF